MFYLPVVVFKVVTPWLGGCQPGNITPCQAQPVQQTVYTFNDRRKNTANFFSVPYFSPYFSSFLLTRQTLAHGACAIPRFAYLSKARGRVRNGSSALDGLEDGTVLLLDGVVPHPVLGLVTRRVQRHLLPHPATISRVVSSANSIEQLARVRSTTVLQTGESAFNECFTP